MLDEWISWNKTHDPVVGFALAVATVFAATAVWYAGFRLIRLGGTLFFGWIGGSRVAWARLAGKSLPRPHSERTAQTWTQQLPGFAG